MYKSKHAIPEGAQTRLTDFKPMQQNMRKATLHVKLFHGLPEKKVDVIIYERVKKPGTPDNHLLALLHKKDLITVRKMDCRESYMFTFDNAERTT